MTTSKTKRTVSLDADLVEALGEGNLSAEVNDALRERVRIKRQGEALRRFLDEVAAEEGPVDEAGVREMMLLLGAEPRIASAA